MAMICRLVPKGKRMKAVMCRNWGPPDALLVEDLPSPKPGNGQISVSVKASGVNFPDVLVIQNKYQFKPELPFPRGAKSPASSAGSQFAVPTVRGMTCIHCDGQVATFG